MAMCIDQLVTTAEEGIRHTDLLLEWDPFDFLITFTLLLHFVAVKVDNVP